MGAAFWRCEQKASHSKENTMTNRFDLYRTAKLALVVGLMALAPGLASAQSQCAAFNLNGTYAFTFSGTATFPGSAAPTLYNGLGIGTFDGAGKFTGTESANFGSFVLRSAALSATYKVNPDCTGIMIAKFPDGSSGNSDLVVADGGKTIHAISVDVGGTTTLTFTRI
jgi:hypothetical protein